MNRYLKYIRENIYQIILLGILVVLLVMPMCKEGITNNDELQSWYWSKLGFGPFFQHFKIDQICHGRALGMPILNITMYLGYIGHNFYSFQIIRVISLLLCVLLFGILIERIFRNSSFALFCAMSLLAFIPITFEPMAPQAYMCLYNLPMQWLLLSLILFWDWLENKQKKYFVGYMCLLFICLLSYEAFVTFVPVYVFLAIYKIGFRNYKKWIKDSLYPIVNSVIWLIVYAISRVIWKSDYSGNQFTMLGFEKISHTLWEFFKTSFPGRFLYSPKYQYLYSNYAQRDVNTYGRVGIIVALFIGLLILVNKNCRKRSNQKYSMIWINDLLVLIVLVLLVVFPGIPYSLTDRNMGEGALMGVVTNFFCYFPASLLVCYVIWRIFQYGPKIVKLFVCIMFVGMIMQIQLMNDAMASKQEANFRRMCEIEDFVESDIMKYFGELSFAAADLYEVRDSLAFHDGYWTDYANQVAKQNVIYRNECGKLENNRIYYTNDDIFLIWVGSDLVIATKDYQSDYINVKITEEDYSAAKCQDWEKIW